MMKFTSITLINSFLLFILILFSCCDKIDKDDIKSCANIHACNTFQRTPKDGKYKDLLDNIIQIKNICGSLCETQKVVAMPETIMPDKTFLMMKKDVNCYTIWNSSIFDRPSPIKFPIQNLPSYILKYFTHNGQIKVLSHYLDDTASGNNDGRRLGNNTFNDLVKLIKRCFLAK